jgi:hypothetical protein
MGHARAHPPPRSRRPPGDLAGLLWRRAHRHDRALCRQSQCGTAVAMAMRVLSGISAWGMYDWHRGELRGGGARPFSPPGEYSCRTGRKPIFKRGRISAIGQRRNIGALIGASACRHAATPTRERELTRNNGPVSLRSENPAEAGNEDNQGRF